jgi:hypothetical protein
LTARHSKSDILDNTKNGYTCRFVYIRELTPQIAHLQATISLLISPLANRYMRQPLDSLPNIEQKDDNMVDKMAITDGSFESSVEIIKTEGHTDMSSSPSDLEKGDLQAAPSRSPETTITAQDWTGPSDLETPQNW